MTIIPNRVSPQNEKFYHTTNIAYYFGFFGHGFGIIGFYMIGVMELFWFNLLFSLPAFGAVIILNRLNKINLAFAFAFFELYLHQVAFVYYLGWDAGGQLLLIYLAGLCFFNPVWSRAIQFIMLAVIAATYVVLYFFFGDGLYTMTDAAVSAMFTISAIGTPTLIGVLIAGYSRNAHRAEIQLQKANAEITAAHKETRGLLLNILPEPIADRLEKGERQIADSVSEATILFSDLVGFTKFSSTKSAETIVTMLNKLFYEFDTIVEEEGLEKIKTIGDGYMVASGLPEPRSDHAVAAIRVALRMQEALQAYNTKYAESLNIRIGISSGPVVAGVIGRNKFTYDLWGDPVNTASRMESHGEPGRIQISELTRVAIADAYAVEPRGSIEIKGKGSMQTYFVSA